MAKAKKRCDKCAFGEPNGDRITCRRFPPASDGNGPSKIDHQPLMKADDWCGEHK